MRLLVILTALCLPNLGQASDRFGDWVASELGFQPFYAQSIGWDMPEPSVTIKDPLVQAEIEGAFVETPTSTAWVVGILGQGSDARLTGLALVWSDDPFDSIVTLGALQTQSGLVAFQTPQQTWVGNALPQDIAAKMIDRSPGPILAQQPDGTVFPVGDAGVARGCLEITALYRNTKDLVALVVLSRPDARAGAADVTCASLTS